MDCPNSLALPRRETVRVREGKKGICLLKKKGIVTDKMQPQAQQQLATQPVSPDKINIDEKCINTLRFLSVDMVQKANSGHPGLPLDAAPMAYVLWTRFLKFNPRNPKWPDRDRFVLSAGHGSALLYSLLHLTGYALSLEDIKQFRQWGSKTPGHPESELTPGVEVITGPLGQGFANGVGLALMEAHLAACYNRPGHNIVNHYTYGIVSDGDLMEGISSEAGSLAGHLKLGKLIYFYDSNRITLSAATDVTFTEDVGKRFEAFGWQVLHVSDGNDLPGIQQALEVAQSEQLKPTLIIIRTHIGYGSPKQDTFEAHGSPLGPEDVKLTKEKLGWPVEPDFYIPEDALRHFREAQERGEKWEQEWNRRFEAYQATFPDLAAEFQNAIQGLPPKGWDADIPAFAPDPKGLATRAASGKIMNAIAPKLKTLIGGSADLNPSTYTALEGQGNFESQSDHEADLQGTLSGNWSYAGRNLFFGVREHGMAGILNGMTAHGGAIPYGATFLIFSDYMRPPIRLAAMMQKKVIYIFTHDSIGLGEDGPTHQPVEQLPGLRAVPGLVVIRPCDANETAMAWRVAVEKPNQPVALILTRQNVPTLSQTQHIAEQFRKGAYVLSDAPEKVIDVILIATGSEVHLALEAQEALRKKNIKARVVSMPCWELFDEQPQEYRDTVLPSHVKARLAIEAASPQGWRRFVGDAGEVLGINHFGASAPGKVVMEKYGFTVENVCKRVNELLEKLNKKPGLASG